MNKRDPRKLADIMVFVENYIHHYDISPTKQEITKGLKMSNDSTKYYLSILKNMGYITYQPNAPRTIAILKDWGELLDGRAMYISTVRGSTL